MPASIHERLQRRWLDLPIRAKALGVVAIPVLCLLLQLAWLARLQRAQRSAAAVTFHSEQVKLTARRLLSALLDAETGVRGYAIGRTGDFLEPYNSAVTAVPETVAQLRELVADNPEQSRRISEISRLAQAKLKIGNESIRLLQQTPGKKTPQALIENTANGKQVMDELRSRIGEFLGAEDQLLSQRAEQLQREWRETDAILWGGLVVGLLGGFLAIWLLGRGVCDRLAVLAGRAQIFGQGTLPPVHLYEADEIGELGKTLFEVYSLAHANAEKLKENERQIRAQRDALETANAELEAFSYSVSHDLRAPLRHVDGFSRILLEDHAPQLGPEAKRLLGRICDGTRRMGVLIDELLNLGRIGRKPLEVQIAGLGALVEQARSELGAEVSGREIEWRIGALPFAECDSGLMRQVFTNLLSNAVKYTRPRPHAVIEVGEGVTQGRRAIFVRDNGVGFSMKYADKLFGVFQRLHRQEDFEGTGVGLAAAARIIQRHGGRIWAEAELDRGACFYFILPSLEPPADANALSVTAATNGVHQ